MYRNIKKVSRDLGIRGWSFLMEDGDKMYLSKFDPDDKRNEDEYRVYFFLKEDGVQIVRKFVLKASKYKENIPLNNKFFKEAQTVLDTYFVQHRKTHFKAS